MFEGLLLSKISGLFLSVNILGTGPAVIHRSQLHDTPCDRIDDGGIYPVNFESKRI